MAGFRLSKYDPKLRTPDGRYGRNEWTSFCDIGREFYDGVLTLSKYQETEDLYVAAIRSFLQTAGISGMVIDAFESTSEDKRDISQYLTPAESKNDCEVSIDVIDQIVRLCLREIVWVRLSGPNDTYLHFGYDFYAYVGARNVGPRAWHPPNGLFAEQSVSPYAT